MVVNNKVLKYFKILLPLFLWDILVNDDGSCEMFKMAKTDFEIDPTQQKLDL